MKKEKAAITLHKNSFTLIDVGKKDPKPKDFKANALKFFLWKSIDVDKDVTLRDLMKIVSDDVKLWAAVTEEGYLSELVDEYNEIKDTKFKPQNDDLPVTSINITKSVHTDVHDNHRHSLKFPKKGGMIFKKLPLKKGQKLIKRKRTYDNFDVSGTVKGESQQYAIEFCEIHSLLDANIVINENVNWYLCDYSGTTKKLKKDKITNLGETKIVVLDLFKWIFSELLFCGSPAMRRTEFKKLTEIVEEVKSKSSSNDKKTSKNVIKISP